MSSGAQHSLNRSVRKSLVLRLAIGGSVICIILAIYVYLANRNTVGEVVVFRMVQVTKLFNDLAAVHLNTEGPLDPLKLQNSLQELAARPHLAMQQGKFVYAGIYDLAGQEIAKIAVSDYELIDQVVSFMKNTSHLPSFENGSTNKIGA